MLGVLDLWKDMQMSCFVYIGFECSHHFNSDYHAYNNSFMYYILALNIFKFSLQTSLYNINTVLPTFSAWKVLILEAY